VQVDKLPAKPFLVTDKPPVLDIKANQGDDPDIPWSGGSSAAFINDNLIQPAAEKVKREARKQRSDLLPVAEDIFKFLDEERAAVGDFRSYMTTLPPGTPGLQIKDEYRARELYFDYLKRFELWVMNRLSKTAANKIKR
jgi:hypothetical protein